MGNGLQSSPRRPRRPPTKQVAASAAKTADPAPTRSQGLQAFTVLAAENAYMGAKSLKFSYGSAQEVLPMREGCSNELGSLERLKSGKHRVFTTGNVVAEARVPDTPVPPSQLGYEAAADLAVPETQGSSGADSQEGQDPGQDLPASGESPEQETQASGPGSAAKQQMAVKTLLQLGARPSGQEQAEAATDEPAEGHPSNENDEDSEEGDESEEEEEGDEEEEGEEGTAASEETAQEEGDIQLASPSDGPPLPDVAVKTTIELSKAPQNGGSQAAAAAGKEANGQQASSNESEEESEEESSSASKDESGKSGDRTQKGAIATANGKAEAQEETEGSTEDSSEGEEGGEEKGEDDESEEDSSGEDDSPNPKQAATAQEVLLLQH